MKVVDKFWFKNMKGTAGIVVIEEPSGERKAYLGVVPGEDESADTDSIVAWGTKLSPGLAQQLANELRSQLSLLTLDNGKRVYIDGKGISREEAHEIIISLTKTWGTDFEKQELKDKVLMDC